VEFIDDYRFLVSLKSLRDDLPCIVLMDTEKDAGGAPVQTSFQLPTHFCGIQHLPLSLERGMHKPSSAEWLAPFHRDRAQRIAALPMICRSGYLVFPVEALLRLSEGYEGCEIRWDEWKMHVIIPFIPEPEYVQGWVSGCRLFSMNFGGGTKVDVYDFSIRGRSKYLTEHANADLGGVGYLASTGASARIPWAANELFDINGGHDSVAFLRVSIPLFSCTVRLMMFRRLISLQRITPMGRKTCCTYGHFDGPIDFMFVVTSRPPY